MGAEGFLIGTTYPSPPVIVTPLVLARAALLAAVMLLGMGDSHHFTTHPLIQHILKLPLVKVELITPVVAF